jgi:hypothetical protein
VYVTNLHFLQANAKAGLDSRGCLLALLASLQNSMGTSSAHVFFSCQNQCPSIQVVKMLIGFYIGETLSLADKALMKSW